MTVYVVTSGAYSDYGIDAIFSTKELAEKYCENNKHQDLNGVDEWELDTDQNVIEREYWDARVGTDKDRNYWLPYGKIEVTGPHFHKNCEKERSQVWEGTGQIICYSYESQEHAHKLAVEAWQKHLAKIATGSQPE